LRCRISPAVRSTHRLLWCAEYYPGAVQARRTTS
jgi:hypothetical protein